MARFSLVYRNDVMEMLRSLDEEDNKLKVLTK